MTFVFRFREGSPPPTNSGIGTPMILDTLVAYCADISPGPLSSVQTLSHFGCILRGYLHRTPGLCADTLQVLTGVPVLLNTSLNGNGQPILETEEDAREFYKNSKLDMMIVNGINI